MLDLSRVRSRSVVGVAVLGLILFGAACAHDAPPPEAPLEAPPEETPPESASATPEPTAEPAPSSEATPATAEPSAETPSTTAPTRDSRGKEQIQQVMAANREKVRACYDAALPQNPGIHGALVLDFVIDPRGDVKRAEVNWSASDLHIPELDTCAVDAVRSIKFPASSGGLESKVSYPFNFNPPRPELPPKKP